jgi:hypothetical protein
MLTKAQWEGLDIIGHPALLNLKSAFFKNLFAGHKGNIHTTWVEKGNPSYCVPCGAQFSGPL